MKRLLSALCLLSSVAFAQETPPTWQETFRLPEGMTYRARMAGYDCGAFEVGYVNTPASFLAHQIEYKQLAADKDLNKFVIEAVYPGTDGATLCTIGTFLDRNRGNLTLDFTHSLIATDGDEAACQAGKDFLDLQMANIAYEGSRRGLRYIAVEVIHDELNEVCESGKVRAVFDRRF